MKKMHPKKNTLSKKTVIVGIPALNEEGNIGKLIKTVLSQKEDTYKLLKIIVISDNSTDKTNSIVKSFKDARVKLIVNRKRIGKPQILNMLFSKTNADFLVIFDADVLPLSIHTVSHLLVPFSKEKNVGLVGGGRKVRKTTSFIGNSLQTSIRAYDKIKVLVRNGNNPYSCHGAILALSRSFVKSMHIPSVIFSDDTFLYFSCISKGYLFRNAQDAKVEFHTPENLRDALIQYKRFLDMDALSKEMFKEYILKEYHVPRLLRYRVLFLEFLKMPVHTFAMYCIKIYSLYYARFVNASKEKWQVAHSTKKGVFTW